jgi:hypothetical protein
MGDTIGSLAQFGVSGLLLVVILVMGVQWTASIRRANSEAKARGERYDAVLRAADEDLVQLTARMDRLQTAFDKLQGELDGERKRRFAAEELASVLTRQLGTQHG